MTRHLPGLRMVFYEVPGGWEVLTGEIPTHPRKYQLHIFLWDFSSGRKLIIKDFKNKKKEMYHRIQQHKTKLRLSDFYNVLTFL